MGTNTESSDRDPYCSLQILLPALTVVLNPTSIINVFKTWQPSFIYQCQECSFLVRELFQGKNTIVIIVNKESVGSEMVLQDTN